MIIDIAPVYEQQIRQLAQEQGLSVGDYVVSLLPEQQSNVKIDIPRMEQALQSERFLMPQGLSMDEMEAFILNVARQSREVW